MEKMKKKKKLSRESWKKEKKWVVFFGLKYVYMFMNCEKLRNGDKTVNKKKTDRRLSLK